MTLKAKQHRLLFAKREVQLYGDSVYDDETKRRIFHGRPILSSPGAESVLHFWPRKSTAKLQNNIWNSGVPKVVRLALKIETACRRLVLWSHFAVITSVAHVAYFWQRRSKDGMPRRRERLIGDTMWFATEMKSSKTTEKEKEREKLRDIKEYCCLLSAKKKKRPLLSSSCIGWSAGRVVDGWSDLWGSVLLFWYLTKLAICHRRFSLAAKPSLCSLPPCKY